MEEESAVSSRYKVEPSLSNPRSGTSSRSESKSDEDRELLLLRTINLGGAETHDGALNKGEAEISRRQTYLSSFSSKAILSKCKWSRCPSLASISQWQLRLLPLLWLLTEAGGGDSIRPTVALRIHPPQDTAKKKKRKKEINKMKVNKVCVYIAREPWYRPTHCGSGVLQRGTVALTQVASSWPRT